MCGFRLGIGWLFAIISFALMPANSAAQEVGSGDSKAVVVTPLSFVKNSDLSFGEILRGTTDGTVTLDSAGNVTTTNGIIHTNGTQQTARFSGFGASNQIVRININADTHILTRNGGTQTIIMDRILIGSRPPIALDSRVRRFRIASFNGFFSFAIGGRLQLPADTLPGTYEGTFAVTLEYE